MAEITVTIPNSQIARAVEALCAAGGYAGTDDVAERRQFARTQIAQFIRQAVMQHERQQAMAQAMAAVTVDPITID